MTQARGDSPSQARDQVAGRLLDAFRRALGIGADVAPATIVRGELPQWDSIGHMELVMEIEGTFGVRLADEDVLTLGSFDRALELVRAAGGAGAA